MGENREQSRVEERESRESEKKDFFNTTKSQIIDIYPFKEGEKEEVEKMFGNLEQQIGELDNEAFVHGLKKIVLFLDNGHTILEKKYSGPKVIGENNVKYVEGKYWFEEGDEWLEIKKINNQVISESIEEMVQITPGGTDEYKKQMAYIGLINDALTGLKESGDPLALNLSVEKDSKIQEKELKYNEIQEPGLDEIISSQIVNDIGILKINTWSNHVKHEGKSVDELVEIELDKLKEADSIIIDVRGNSGGDSSIAMKLAGRFINEEKKYLTCRKRIAGQNEYEEGVQRVEPVEPYLDKKVAVLTDSKCFSSNEMFVASMKDTGKVITIGETTGGGSGNPRSTDLKLGDVDYRLNVSSWRQYRNNGQEFEGKGIEPDIEAHQTIEDLHNGKDTVLEIAIEYLNKENDQDRS